MKTATVILSILALSSCASTSTPTPSNVLGKSAVDEQLKNDAYEMLKVTASSQTKCKNIESAEVTSSTVSKKKVTEIWVANGCGEKTPFNVKFIPSQKGGYTYQISPIR